MFQTFYRYVAIVSYKCCKSRSRDDAYVASASIFLDACCNHFFLLDVAYISHICCNSMFRIFYLFQAYVAPSDFMLQVASALFECFMCSTRKLQAYVPDVLSLCFFMLRVIYVVRPRATQGPTDWALGSLDEGAAVRANRQRQGASKDGEGSGVRAGWVRRASDGIYHRRTSVR